MVDYSPKSGIFRSHGRL